MKKPHLYLFILSVYIDGQLAFVNSFDMYADGMETLEFLKANNNIDKMILERFCKYERPRVMETYKRYYL